ncbi:c-type cytochrome [Psychrobacter sp. CAL346-MNA-CIBAN-0220]|uniref:c-type cytochrome n=1 Tax=Psychrobacter sp. CAL346-MNA-CIBAN-0220 TaxID=3140457 RepID=UPI00331B42CD
MPINFKVQLSSILITAFLLTACERTPPDYRTPVPVTLPVYTEGDADRGAIIFEEACGQCHQLNPGSNKKGPQLMNIYGASAAGLADYNYSEGLTASGWVWDVETLDPYIADAEKAMPDSKMLADPMPDAGERADVIAYLSTLRAAIPALDADGFPIAADANKGADKGANNEQSKMSNEPIEISPDAAQKPAADFQ